MAVATHRVSENAGGARRTKRTDVKSARPCLLLFVWVCKFAASFLFGEKCGGFLCTGNTLFAAIAGLHKQEQKKNIFIFYLNLLRHLVLKHRHTRYAFPEYGMRPVYV